MRWLKFIVIGMGFLIVLGIVLLGYGFYKKSSDPGWRLFGRAEPTAPSTAPAPDTAPPAMPPVRTMKPRGNPVEPFGDIDLALPSVCRIIDVKPNRRRVLVLSGPAPECERVYVIDLIDGKVLGTISPRSPSPGSRSQGSRAPAPLSPGDTRQ